MDLVVRNVLLGISLAAPIGPSGVAVIQNGLGRGFRRGFLTGLGVTLAAGLVLLGFAARFAYSAYRTLAGA